MKTRYSFTTKVWKWPGLGGWHFVTLPREYFTEIRGKYGKGMISVIAKVGKTSWNAKLFPHIRSQSYILSIKKPIRKVEDIWDGDAITVSIALQR